jgi:hypothetical protein
MKTSQKIILGAGLMATTMIFTTMVIIRDDIQTLFVKDDNLSFKSIDVGAFDQLEFSKNYQADIRSGLDYIVEIAVQDSTRVHPELKLLDGTLYFSSHNADSLIIKARITMPVLKSVWGSAGSEITIRNFKSDSMAVSIEKGCVLKGKGNVIKYLTFRSGDALMEWTNNP